MPAEMTSLKLFELKKATLSFSVPQEIVFLGKTISLRRLREEIRSLLREHYFTKKNIFLNKIIFVV